MEYETEQKSDRGSKDPLKHVFSIEALFYLVLLIAAVILILLLLFGKPFVVVSGMSMYPTYSDGECLQCSRVRDAADLQYGDVIVFESPEKKNHLLIKRVIALPGDTIEIESDGIYLNGAILTEDFPVPDNPGLFNEETVVPENSIVAIGDNRNNSRDCRFFGPISFDSIRYKAEKPVENAFLSIIFHSTTGDE